MKKSLLPLFLALLAAACSTTGDTAREVKRETAEQRKAPVVLGARNGNQYFHLRQNNFFDYLDGSSLYAGTYTQKGDSLMLGFHNNYQPADLTGKALVNRTDGVLVLFSKDGGRDRRLTIIP